MKVDDWSESHYISMIGEKDTSYYRYGCPNLALITIITQTKLVQSPRPASAYA